eukprot:CAMPEP_0197197076 /NCGR_PEP_ID=MMETSP1423-20130617/32601_1 /TAXON_ID=476441 /ORGANISM="Pseudo-nitzschia heimii, Strain UNC1101" /LENGTH=411 /DNA_ID=CAMNT_0042650893 /DNA_START=150 /DNA_END=1384 /DNA_ORIENTATION=-
MKLSARRLLLGGLCGRAIVTAIITATAIMDPVVVVVSALSSSSSSSSSSSTVVAAIMDPVVVVVSALSSSSSSSSSSSPSSSLYGETTRNVATQVLQGTGVPRVDLSRYDLPFEVVREGWKAEFAQKATESEGRVRLAAVSELEHYVELLSFDFPRRRVDGTGLGIELEELAGGRDDGIGITLVSDLSEGGSAEGSGLRPGDVLTSVGLVRRRRVEGAAETTTSSPSSAAAIAETQEEFSVATECLDYDATVDAIVRTIPPPPSSESSQRFDDFYVVRAKRLRRIPKVRVRLTYPPSSSDQRNNDDETIVFEMRAGENLRQGMLARGVKLNDPLAKRFDAKTGGNCGAGGLCRTCAVCVTSGADLLNPQRVAEKQALGANDNARWRLACKAVVGHGMTEGEIVVRVNPNRW